MDLRTQKVYDSLMEAFQQLLEEKCFEDITVNELCVRAKTRRATFYKHFSDKYDFFQFLLNRMREELLEDARKRSKTKEPKEYFHILVDLGLEFVEKHKQLLVALKDSAVASEMIQTITTRTFEAQSEYPLLDDELTVQFLIGGLNQCVRWWMRNMSKATKADVQSRLYELVDKYAEGVL